MKEYKGIIFKAVIIVILIIIVNILTANSNKAYIPDYETGLPQNTYYTEEDFGYDTLYISDFVNNFIINLYNKNYEGIYEVLTENSKKNRYTNIDELKNYIEKYFDGIINTENIDDIYSVELDYDVLNDYTKIGYFFNTNENNKNEEPGLKITIILKGPYDMKIEM